MRRVNAAAAATRKVSERRHEKRSQADAGTESQPTPQKPESTDARLRVERTGREDSRHRFASRGKIHPTRARRAGLGRSGRGGKLLSACRALFPGDRGGAGAISATEP